MLMFWCSTAWMSARFSTPSDCCSSGRTRCTHQTLLSHLSGWVDTSCFGLAKFSFVCSSFVWLRLVWYWSCPFSYFRWKKVFKIIHSIREFSNEICGKKNIGHVDMVSRYISQTWSGRWDCRTRAGNAEWNKQQSHSLGEMQKHLWLLLKNCEASKLIDA